jgi:hypothetical protein
MNKGIKEEKGCSITNTNKKIGEVQKRMTVHKRRIVKRTRCVG